MKIVVMGYYGENFGDLLMLEVLREMIEHSGAELVIFTYGDKCALEDLLSSSANKVAPRVYGLKGQLAVSTFRSEIKGASALVWGGGTCFMDQGGTGGVKFLALAMYFGVPTYYLGVGVDKREKLITKLYLLFAGLFSRGIFARDVVSYQVFKRYSPFRKDGFVKSIPDLAFGWNRSAFKLNDEPYVLFCPRDLGGYVNNQEVFNNEILTKLLEVCSRLNTKSVRVFVGDADVDSKVADKATQWLASKGCVSSLVKGGQLNEAVESISNAAFVFSVRLHPAVVAHIYQVPYLIVNYSDKNRKFAAEVDSHQRVLEMNNVQEYVPDYERPSNEVVESLRGQLYATFDGFVSGLSR